MGGGGKGGREGEEEERERERGKEGKWVVCVGFLELFVGGRGTGGL